MIGRLPELQIWEFEYFWQDDDGWRGARGGISALPL